MKRVAETPAGQAQLRKQLRTVLKVHIKAGVGWGGVGWGGVGVGGRRLGGCSAERPFGVKGREASC